MQDEPIDAYDEVRSDDEGNGAGTGGERPVDDEVRSDGAASSKAASNEAVSGDAGNGDATGDAAVDEALRTLRGLQARPVHEHVAAIDQAHRALQERLAEEPADDHFAGDRPAEDRPAEDRPAEDQSAEDRPAEDHFAGDQPNHDQSAHQLEQG